MGNGNRQYREGNPGVVDNDVGRMRDLASRIAPHIAAILSLLQTPAPREDDLVPLAEATRVASTSLRVLREAIRANDIPAYGRQRDRSVRRGDLLRWVESRRVVHSAIEDDDLERRMRRLARASGGG
jgi:hypothetical protein